MEKFGLTTRRGVVVLTADDAKLATLNFSCKVVIKAQVQVGGRGKAGGVKLADTPEDAFNVASNILGMDIKGIKVKKILVAEAIDFTQEIYVGITVDRAKKQIVLMGSLSGGVDIEDVAAKTPEKIKKIYIDPLLGLKDYQARELAFELFSDMSFIKQAISIFHKLYKLFIDNDCSLAEINPLVITNDGRLLALDSKINFDDNSLDRHSDFEKMRDLDEEDADELEAKKFGLSFVKLDGNIGCIVNGAGLAMGTMDMIKLFGGEPANFLDVGGSSSPEKIVKAFELLLKNKNVKAVLINIFGGITRCDDIANGLLAAKSKMDISSPLVIRLVGTNEEAGCKILSSANLLAYSSMEEAVKKVIEIAKIGEKK